MSDITGKTYEAVDMEDPASAVDPAAWWAECVALARRARAEAAIADAARAVIADGRSRRVLITPAGARRIMDALAQREEA